jgi:diacylglycerol kinase (ATP)
VATEGPCTAGRLARRAVADGAEWVIAAGGDGTISEVVEGLAGGRVPLGILPAGTANVLARELRMPMSLQAAAHTLLNCTAQRVAIGLIEQAQRKPRHFLMMAGAGFDADVIFHLNHDLKEWLGRVSYWVGGLARLPRRLEQLEVRAGGQTYWCSFALIARVRNYGGDFVIATEASLMADDFAVVLLEGEQGLVYLRHLAGVVTQQLRRLPGVHVLRAREVELSPGSQPVHLQADGEYVGQLPAKIRVAPETLWLMMR